MMDLIEESPHQPKKDSFQLELAAKMEERRVRGLGSGFSPRDSNNSCCSNDEDNLPMGMSKLSKHKTFNLNDTLRFDSTKYMFDKQTLDTDFLNKSNQYRSTLQPNDVSGKNSKMKHSQLREANIDEFLNSSTDSLQMKKDLQYSSSNILEMLPEHSLSRKSKELTSSEEHSLLTESLQSYSEADPPPRHRFLKSTKNMQETKSDKGEDIAATCPKPTPRAHKTDSISSSANKNCNSNSSLSDILGDNGFSKGTLPETNNHESKYNSLQRFEDINEGNTNGSLQEVPENTSRTKDSASVCQQEKVEAGIEDKQSKNNLSNYDDNNSDDDDDDDDDILSYLLKRKNSKNEEKEIVKKTTDSTENREVTLEYNEDPDLDSKNENLDNDSNSDEISEISRNTITLLDGGNNNIEKPIVKPRKPKQQTFITVNQNDQHDQQEELIQLSDGLRENMENKRSISNEVRPQSWQSQHLVSNVKTKPKPKQKETRMADIPPELLNIDLLREETFKIWRQEKDKKIKELQKEKEKEKEKKIWEQKERLHVATITFNAWKQQKDPLIKKKLKVEKNKEEEKKIKEDKEKIEKIEGAKTCFEIWKKNKDEILSENQKKIKKKELLKTQKLNKEKLDKEQNNMTAFMTWKKVKENILHEEKLGQKQKMEMTIKEKEAIKSQKETLSYESYKHWLTRKEETEKEATLRKRQNSNYFEPKSVWRPPSRTVKPTQ